MSIKNLKQKIGTVFRTTNSSECEESLPHARNQPTYTAENNGEESSSNDESTPKPIKSEKLQKSSSSSSGGAMHGKDVLLKLVEEPTENSMSKVSIIGCGAVGMACAMSVISQKITSELVLIDVNEEKAKGEMLDLQHGSAFIKSVKISSGSDYKLTASSKIIVITAGVSQKPGDTRLKLLGKNLEILKSMIPSLAKYSPEAIILIVTNPVDVLTYLTWKLSGFPQNRVIGSGTNLDTSRFRFLISKKLNIAVESVHGWIIGEHGDSSVPVWSGVNVAGVSLKESYPALGTDNDPDNWQKIHKEVVDSAYEVIKLKNYTSWAIGLSVADICDTILRNTQKIHAISFCAKGIHGIDSDIYLSIPCALGENGVSYIVKQRLTEEELKKLHGSANILGEYIQKLVM